jgi:hypothetical protein
LIQLYALDVGDVLKLVQWELYYGILRIINQIFVSIVDIVSDIVHMRYLH